MHIKKFSDINTKVFEDLCPMCQTCIHTHMEEKGLEFRIDCRPVPKDTLNFDWVVSQFKSQGMSEEEALKSAYAIHVEGWARDKLKFPPNSKIQREMYACTAKRKVGRAHRRAGKTFSVKSLVLHRACHTNNTIVIVAPYDGQIARFFGDPKDGLEQIILSSSQEIQELVITPPATRSGRLFRAKPSYQMMFTTGATIMGHVLRTTNKARGSSLRGAGAIGLRNVEELGDISAQAGLVVIDESDYLAAEDWETIGPIMEESGGVNDSIEISTPQGKREQFYKHCRLDPKYREFYLPITMRPDILAAEPEEAARLLAEVRALCTTEDEFQREYMAAFGVSLDALFKPDDLLAASQDRWKYTNPVTNMDDCPVCPKPPNGIIRTVGVDPNRHGNGTRIWVAEYRPSSMKDMPGNYRFIDRWIISNFELNQTRGMQAIVCANRIFRPEWIYADRGFFDMQHEQLKLIGLAAIHDPNRGPRHPDAALLDIAKAIDMQEHVPVPDRANMQNPDEWRPRTNKALMIQYYQAMVENGCVIFNGAENSDEAGLIAALTRYKIERWSNRGDPVFIDEGDHDVIASALALYPFYKNTTLRVNTQVQSALILAKNGNSPSIELMPKYTPNKGNAPSGLFHRPDEEDKDPTDASRVLLSINGVAVPRGGGRTTRPRILSGRGFGFTRRGR